MNRTIAALVAAALFGASSVVQAAPQTIDFSTTDLSSGIFSSFEQDNFNFVATGPAFSGIYMQNWSSAPLTSAGIRVGDTGGNAASSVTITQVGGADFTMTSFFVANRNASTGMSVTGRNNGATVFTQNLGNGASATVNFGNVVVDEVRISGTTSFAFDSTFGELAYFDNFTIDVPNLAPTIANLNGDSQNYTDGGAATALDRVGTAATVADGDSANFAGGALSASIVRNGFANQDILQVGNVGSISLVDTDVLHGATIIGTITSSGQAGNALVVTLNASATPAIAQDLVRAIQYRNSGAATLELNPRRVRVALTDGDGAPPRSYHTTMRILPQPAPPGTITADFNVASPALNTNPNNFTSGGFRFTTSESSPGNNPYFQSSFDTPNTPGVIAGANGVTGQTVFIQRDPSPADFTLVSFVVGNETSGNVTVTALNNGATIATRTLATGSAQQLDFGSIVADEIRIAGTTGGSFLRMAKFDDLVVAVNNVPPTVLGLNGDNPLFTQSGAPVALDTGTAATVTDPDSANFNAGRVDARIVTNLWSGQDVLQVGTVGSIAVSGTTVNHAGTGIGTITATGAGTPLTITLNANATVSRVQDLLRALQYRNSNTTNPDLGDRSVQVTVEDGGGAPAPVSLLNLRVRPTALAGNTPIVVDFNGLNVAGTPNSVDFQSYRFSVAGGTQAYVSNGAGVPNAPGLRSGATDIASQTLTIRRIDTADFLLHTLIVRNESLENVRTLTTRNNGTVVQTLSLVDGGTQRILFNDSAVDELTIVGTTGLTSAGLAVIDDLSILVPNSPPTITGAVAAQAVNEGVAISPFTGVTIGDVDTPAQTLAVTVTLDTAAKGALTNLGGGTYVAGTGVYSFSGTAAAATTAVRGLVFTPATNRVAPGNTETTTFTIAANDGVASTVSNNTTTVVSTSIDDPPVIGSNGGGASATIPVAENTTAVTTVAATDVDSSPIAYSVLGTDAARFTIGSATGVLTFTTAPDFEAPTDADANNSYLVTVRASAGTGFDDQALTVNVTNVNDNTPVVTAGQSSSVAENTANTTLVGTLVATDGDAGTTFSNWTIVSGNTGGAFSLTAGNGQLRVANSAALDREARRGFTLNVTVGDGANTSAQASVTINLTDVNDVLPVIAAGQNFTLAENTTAATTVGTLTASDGDFTATTLQNWTIASGNTGGAFALDAATGVLSVANAAALDRETTASFSLGITVRDGVNTSASTPVVVTLTDINDVIPVIGAAQTFNLAENSAAGAAVGTVAATDADVTATTFSNWTLVSGNASGAFALNPGTGAITVASSTPLDFETTTSFVLGIRVSDGVNDSVVTNVTVALTNVNDIVPAVTPNQSATIAENTGNGTLVATLAATDGDAGATTFQSWTLVSGNTGGAFSLGAGDGQLRVANAAALDRETLVGFTLQVSVGDGVNTSASETVTVTLSDVNDLTPVISGVLNVAIAESTGAATVVLAPGASDGDVTPTVFNWSITSGNTGGAFAIDPATGIVTVANVAALDREVVSSFSLDIRVSDGVNAANAPALVTLTDVNDVLPVIAAAQSFTLAENSAAGTAVGSVLASDGDVTATTFSNWTLVSGNASGAFALNPGTGAITVASGTPLDFETTPSFALGVRVSDGVNDSVVTIVTVALGNLNDNVPAVTPNQSPTVAENTGNGTLVATLAATDGDAGATTFQSWTIVSGNTGGAFSLDAGNGQLQVANAAALDRETTASFALQVTVSDGVSTSASETVTVTLSDVNDVLPVIAAGQDFTIAENPAAAATLATLTASDGDVTPTTFNWTIASGNTGGAFALDSATGVLSVANAAAIDREALASFSLGVSVGDGANTSNATILVTLTDLNDVTPVIAAAQAFSLPENSAAGTAVGTLAATDGDVTPTPFSNWALVSGNGSGAFALDANTGAITVADSTPLDFETTPSFVLGVQVGDGSNTSAVQTVTVALGNVNEAPVVAGLDGDATTTGRLVAVAVDNGADAAVTDVDNVAADDGQLAIARTTAFTGSFTLDTAIATSGGDDAIAAGETVAVGGQAIGTVAAGSDGQGSNALVVDFAGGGVATYSRIAQLLHALRYASLASGQHDFSLTLRDLAIGSGGVSSAPVTFSVLVNNAPEITLPPPQSVAEEDVLVLTGPNVIHVDDPDGVGPTLTLTLTVDHGVLTAVQGSGATVTGDGTDTLTIAGPRGTVSDALDGVGYAPTADYNGPESLEVTAADGVDANSATLAITVTPTNDAPSFTVSGDRTHVGGESGAQVVPGFVTAIVFGPPDEAGQAVLEYDVTEQADANNVVDGVEILPDGTLVYAITGSGGVATLAATLRDSGGTANGGVDVSAPVTFTVSVGNSVDVRITKTDGRDAIQEGNELVYAITVFNAGPSIANGVVVNDILPPRLENAVWMCTPAGGAVCTADGTGNLVDSVDLPVGASAVYVLRARVKLRGDNGVIVNTATITVPPGLGDTNALNNSASDETRTDLIFDDQFEDPDFVLQLLRLPPGTRVPDGG